MHEKQKEKNKKADLLLVKDASALFVNVVYATNSLIRTSSLSCLSDGDKWNLEDQQI